MQNFTFFVKYVMIRVVTYSMFLLIAEREKMAEKEESKKMAEKLKWSFKKFFLEVISLVAFVLFVVMYFNAWSQGHFIHAVCFIFLLFSALEGFFYIRRSYKFKEKAPY